MSNEKTPKPVGITFKHHITHEGFARGFKSLRDGIRDAEKNYREIEIQNDRDGLPASDIQKKGLEALEGQRRIADAILENLVESAQRGEAFPTGRPEGAISNVTKHIRQLVTNSPCSTTKELERNADKEIIKEMSSGRFANAVSEARKELNLPKPKKTKKPTFPR